MQLLIFILHVSIKINCDLCNMKQQQGNFNHVLFVFSLYDIVAELVCKLRVCALTIL